MRLCDDCPHPNLRLKILRAVLACSPQDDGGTSDGADGGDKKTSGGESSTYDGLNKHDPRKVLAEYEKKQGLAGISTGENSDDEDEVDGNKVDEDEMKIVKSTVWTCPPAEVSEDASTSTEGDALSHLQNVDVATIHHVPAADRKPANHHDLRIYATPPNTIRMTPPAKATKRNDISLIPGEQYGAFVLTNVLSASECEQLLHIAETKMKYIPDHPTSSHASGSSIPPCWIRFSSGLCPTSIRPSMGRGWQGSTPGGGCSDTARNELIGRISMEAGRDRDATRRPASIRRMPTMAIGGVGTPSSFISTRDSMEVGQPSTYRRRMERMVLKLCRSNHLAGPCFYFLKGTLPASCMREARSPAVVSST